MNVIYFDRWSDRNSKGKISVNVAFPQQLDVKKFCHPGVVSDCSLYNLSAVVVHHGRGFGSGHYTAYCWNSEAGRCQALYLMSTDSPVSLPLFLWLD